MVSGCCVVCSGGVVVLFKTFGRSGGGDGEVRQRGMTSDGEICGCDNLLGCFSIWVESPGHDL